MPRDELRRALHGTAAGARLVDRDALLDSLVARIADGGLDVAGAPVPAAAPRPRITRSRFRKAAGTGLGGLVALLVGSAAVAAGGVWLTFGRDPASPLPTISNEGPVPSHSSPQSVGPTSQPLETATGGPAASLAPVLDDALETVDEVVRDVVAPVIRSISLDGQPASVLGALTCSATLPVEVRVDDQSKVASVTVRVSLGDVLHTTLKLRHVSGDRWTGTVPQLELGSLGDVFGMVRIDVTAKDTAGNRSTSRVSVPLLSATCLG